MILCPMLLRCLTISISSEQFLAENSASVHPLTSKSEFVVSSWHTIPFPGIAATNQKCFAAVDRPYTRCVECDKPLKFLNMYRLEMGALKSKVNMHTVVGGCDGGSLKFSVGKIARIVPEPFQAAQCATTH